MKYIQLSLWVLLWCFGQYAIAAVCPSQSVCNSVFSAPAQTNTTTGTISIGGTFYNDPYGTQIPASTGNITNATCSSSLSGGSACTATGTPGGQLCPGAFQVSSAAGGNFSSGNGTLGGTNNSITDYGNVTVSNNNTVSFSTNSTGATVYRINTLTVKGGGDA